MSVCLIIWALSWGSTYKIGAMNRGNACWCYNWWTNHTMRYQGAFQFLAIFKVCLSLMHSATMAIDIEGPSWSKISKTFLKMHTRTNLFWPLISRFWNRWGSLYHGIQHCSGRLISSGKPSTLKHFWQMHCFSGVVGRVRMAAAYSLKSMHYCLKGRGRLAVMSHQIL